MSRPPSAPTETLHASVALSNEHGNSLHVQQTVHSGAMPPGGRVDRSAWRAPVPRSGRPKPKTL